jgi:transposase
MVRDAANRLAQEPDVGRVADSVIAERLGISRKTVLAWRKKHQIRAWDDPTPRPAQATPGVAAPGAAAPGAAAPGVSGAAPKRAKPSRLDAFAHLLGTQSDRALAELAGVSPENVRMYRQRRGIEARWRADGGPPTRVEAALEELKDQLGLLPDATIAQRAGVSRSAVTQHRAKMGIVAGRKDSATLPAAPIAGNGRPARRPATRGAIGFEVTIRRPTGEETVTVIGADATAAIAAAASLGEVLALRRIGRVV